MNKPAELPSPSHFDTLAYAFEAPTASAHLRSQPEDFCVQETLSFEPSGNGNHAYLYIQKREFTTEELAKHIARVAGVTTGAVGYAGLKDRHAVTSQWFSVDLSGKSEPNWRQLEGNNVQVLNVTCHERKLKKGAIKHNRFALTLRNLQGDVAQLDRRLQQVCRRGVPNYFAEQRFGIEENNLQAAYRMLTGGQKVKNRYLRGLYYSAARSFLFNHVLSNRVSRDLWDRAVRGDALVLDGSRAFFVAHEIDESIQQRLACGDIHPSGPLWGKGELASQHEARALELQVLQDFQTWCQGLDAQGLEQQRRALRVLPRELSWQFAGNQLRLEFSLPSGAYATSVARELVWQMR